LEGVARAGKGDVMLEPDSKYVDEIVPAANKEPRRSGLKPEILILHYTGMKSARRAIGWLACAESNVSCHYVIDEDGRITQLVSERLRAWHAGQSFWRGERDINSKSIGIEIQNPGHEDGYPAFPKKQMLAVAKLSRDIVQRHKMSAENVLAHSDVAPQRKIDPGEKFNWGWLFEQGIGRWVKPASIRVFGKKLKLGAHSDDLHLAQKLLALYGYDVKTTGILDEHTSKVLRAFQLHFRQRRVDGLLDYSTLATLERLIEASGKNKTAPSKSERIARHGP
jgi:N-acetylmuramoyl-L-alanine amidase